MNDLCEQTVGIGKRFTHKQRVAQHNSDTDDDTGKGKQQHRGEHRAAKALYLTEHFHILI